MCIRDRDILVNEKNKVKKLIVAGSMSSYGEGLYNCVACGNIRPSLRGARQMESGQWELKCPKCNSFLTPLPIREKDELRCTSVYALTKKVQEQMSLIIGKTYNIPTIVFRYFNVYGPRQSLSNPYTGVAAIFLSRLKNDNPPIVYEDGKQTRSFISVHDVVEANIVALENDKSDYKVFNLGSLEPTSIADIAFTLARLLGKEIQPNITGKFRKGDIRHCCSDISFISEILSWRPKVSFKDGMDELIKWAKETQAIDKFDLANNELRNKGLL